MKHLLFLFLLFILPIVSHAQTIRNAQFRYATSLPGTCLPNRSIVYVVTGAIPYQYYVCTDTNTFASIGSGSAIPFTQLQTINTARLLGRTTAGTGVIEQLQVGSPFTLSALSLDLASAGIAFSKIQNVSTNTLVGRSTAGTGSVESLSVSSPLVLTGGALTCPTCGGGASSPETQDEGVSLGNAGIFNFVGSGVTATFGGSTVTVTVPGVSASLFSATNKTTDYTALTTDWLVKMDATAGTGRITFYAAAGNANKILEGCKIDTTVNIVNVRIDGTDYPLYSKGCIRATVNNAGSAWDIL